MEFLKEYWYWGVILVLMVLDHILKKKKPQLWWRLQLPWNVAFSAFSLFFVGVMCYACWKIATSGLGVVDRVFYVLLFGACGVVFVFMNVKTWRDWRREHRRRREEAKD